MVSSLWGPAYRGLGGYFRKMGELAIAPNNYPFMIGAVSSFVLIASIPVSDKDLKESSPLRLTPLSAALACACEFSNRGEIMEEKKARTGSYH